MMSCKKVSFANEAAATFYINKLKQTSTRIVIPKRTYLCQYCLNYHLTHRDEFVSDGHMEQIKVLTAGIHNCKEQKVRLKAEIVKLKVSLNEARILINHLKKNT